MAWPMPRLAPVTIARGVDPCMSLSRALPNRRWTQSWSDQWAHLDAGLALAEGAGIANQVCANASGLLGLSRNLGLVTGASLMGAVFFGGAGARTIAAADEMAVAAGTHAAFLVATLMVGLAILAIAVPELRSRAGTALFRRRGRA